MLSRARVLFLAPLPVQACRGCFSRAVVFSAGGDAVRKPLDRGNGRGVLACIHCAAARLFRPPRPKQIN
jgi:hypothetical protein